MIWGIVIGAVAVASIYSGVLIWCVLAIRTTTRIGAEVLDIHTNKLREHSADIKTLRESSFPRYTGTPVPDPAWIAHDDAVTAALAAPLVERAAPHKLAQKAVYDQPDPAALADTAIYAPPGRPANRWAGEGLPDPESAPFFTQSQPE